MENKKCILFVRVSTKIQNFDEQEKEIHQMALNDGYLPENIIAIAEKESGRKLKEEERKGINIMKQYIENDKSINCVYLWEISRLARTRTVLFSVRDYLIEHNVNVKILKPYCELLNPDGTLNEMGDMAFTMYAHMAEAEMRTKISRFRRTKKVNSSQMKYSGGKIMYGYKINENGYYEVDEEKANIIRLIFTLYTTKNIGAIQLRKELEERGYTLKGFLIQKILRNTAYLGYYDYSKLVKKTKIEDSENKIKTEPIGNLRKYPPIITKEIFDKAQKRKEENKTQTDKAIKHTWLCAKLIKCTECGGYMIANGGARVYNCKAHSHLHFYKKNCTNKLSINISAIDGIAWHFAKSLFFADSLADKERQIKDNEQQIKVLTEKLNASPLTEKKINEKEQRIIEAFLDAEISKDSYTLRLNKIRDERKNFEIKIAEYKNDVERLMNEIKYLQNDKKNLSDMQKKVQRIKDVLHLSKQEISKQDKYNIVHRYIKSIEINETILYFHLENEYGEVNIYREKINNNDKTKKAKEITIHGINGKISTYFFIYNEKKAFNQFAKLNTNSNIITAVYIEKQ